MPNRGRVTQHTIQPHIASKHAKRTTETCSQETASNLSTPRVKHQAYSSATLPIYCFHSPRTGVSCDPTPIAFYCACHTIVLPYMLQGQLRPYPPHRGRVTTDSKEVGSQPTPLPPRGHCLSSSYALALSLDLKAKHYSRLASLKAESNYRDMYYSQHKHMQIEHQPQEQRSHNWKGCQPFLLNREVCFDRICNDVMLHPTPMRPAIQQKGQEAKQSLRKATKQLYTSWKIRGKS